MEVLQINKRKIRLNAIQIVAILLLVISAIVSPEIIVVMQFIILIGKCLIDRSVIKLILNKKYMYLYIFLIIHSMINILLGNHSPIELLKQLIGIGVSYTFYYIVFKDVDVFEIFKVYIKFLFVLSVFILIQQISFLFNVTFLYDLSWIHKEMRLIISETGFYRPAAVFGEPAAFCYFAALGVYFSLDSILTNNYTYVKKHEAIIISVAYVMTFSSIGILAVIGTCILVNIKLFLNKDSRKKVYCSILFSILLFLVCYIFVLDFRMRLNDTIVGIVNMNVNGLNLSTITLLIHFKSTIYILIESFGMGTGLGSYVISFEKYRLENSLGIIPNHADANSLALRMCAELGIWGIIIIISFIKKYIIFNAEYVDYQRISTGILVYFFTRLVRSGHYFVGGFFFFVVLFMMCFEQKEKK